MFKTSRPIQSLLHFSWTMGDQKQPAPKIIHSPPLIIEVDSHARVNGTHGSFDYKIQLPTGNTFTRVVVLDGVFPKSYYAIQEDQDFFFLFEGAESRVVVVPFGNYTSTSFADIIIPQLDAASADMKHNYSYAVEEIVETNRWRFTVSGNGGVQPQFAFNDFVNQEMGFDQNETYAFVDDELTSSGMRNFSSRPRIYIRSNLADNANNDSHDVLASIPAAVPDWTYVTYMCPDPRLFSRPLRKFGSANPSFLFVDDDDHPLDFNGLPVLFSILFYDHLYDT